MTPPMSPRAPRPQAALRIVWMLAWMTFVWVALWRDVSWGTAAAGFLAALGVVTIARLPSSPWGVRVRPFAAFKFFVVFVVSVVSASLIVAWRVLTPWNRVREGIVGVPLRTAHPVVITAVNHAITLAPGTMVVDIHHNPTVVFVHVLDLDDPSTIHADVHRLEALAKAAFGLAPDHSDAPVDPPTTATVDPHTGTPGRTT